MFATESFPDRKPRLCEDQNLRVMAPSCLSAYLSLFWKKMMQSSGPWRPGILQSHNKNPKLAPIRHGCKGSTGGWELFDPENSAQ